MSELKATPGPWACEPVIGRKFERGIMSNYGCLGVVYGNSERDYDENFANACLIAAAPDLLQELQNIANADTAEWDDPSEFEAWAKSRARAAINKAIGSES